MAFFYFWIGRKQNTTYDFYLHKSKYKIQLSDAASNYKPGLPYSLLVSIIYYSITHSTDKYVCANSFCQRTFCIGIYRYQCKHLMDCLFKVVPMKSECCKVLATTMIKMHPKVFTSLTRMVYFDTVLWFHIPKDLHWSSFIWMLKKNSVGFQQINQNHKHSLEQSSERSSE